MADEVVQFVGDDEGYLGWIAAHPGGFVINCYRVPTASYVVLHRATCRTIQGQPTRGQTWTCSDYSKVCGESSGALNKWSLANLHTLPRPCELCW